MGEFFFLIHNKTKLKTAKTTNINECLLVPKHHAYITQSILTTALQVLKVLLHESLIKHRFTNIMQIGGTGHSEHTSQITIILNKVPDDSDGQLGLR